MSSHAIGLLVLLSWKKPSPPNTSKSTLITTWITAYNKETKDAFLIRTKNVAFG